MGSKEIQQMYIRTGIDRSVIVALSAEVSRKRPVYIFLAPHNCCPRSLFRHMFFKLLNALKCQWLFYSVGCHLSIQLFVASAATATTSTLA